MDIVQTLNLTGLTPSILKSYDTYYQETKGANIAHSHAERVRADQSSRPNRQLGLPRR